MNFFLVVRVKVAGDDIFGKNGKRLLYFRAQYTSTACLAPSVLSFSSIFSLPDILFNPRGVLISPYSGPMRRSK
jgi:hypothetical protein